MKVVIVDDKRLMRNLVAVLVGFSVLKAAANFLLDALSEGVYWRSRGPG